MGYYFKIIGMKIINVRCDHPDCNRMLHYTENSSEPKKIDPSILTAKAIKCDWKLGKKKKSALCPDHIKSEDSNESNA